MSARSAAEDLDRAVHAHLARMPAPTRAILEPLVADGAPDAWLRDALLAYLRYFVRVFDRDEPPERAEGVLADELSRLTDVARTGASPQRPRRFWTRTRPG